MKSHVWRPLYVALGIVACMLLLRLVLVPKDFGIWERGYMYGFHNKANEAYWKDIKVKYMGQESCKPCHKRNYDDIKKSPHTNIDCENCHGPLLEHPKAPAKMSIDSSRSLCLRCHLKLPYKPSDRGSMKGINPDTHHPSEECVLCHYPHNPTREVKK
jgi:hypothetical protein